MEEVKYLVVDDDDRFREQLVKGLQKRGLEVFAASGAEQAYGLATDNDVDRALVDLSMPGDSGLVVTRELLKKRP